ncbi:MAG: methyltransferase domain-containing protein, partial [Alphaproteobacteria bacterium]|nr:methyltransferase domain-containing protein [Alphaproteobacteria bacterium]
MTPTAPDARADGDLYETPPCPFCGAERRTSLYRSVKRVGEPLGEVRVSVSQCDDCGFVYNAPRVREDVLESYYATSSLASGQVFRDESAQGYYPQLNARRARHLAGVLRSHPRGRLLDVGCGVGGFLDAMKAELPGGWELYGLEPSRNAHRQSTDKGYAVANALLGSDGMPAGSFDAISMISVLEHTTDPMAALERIRELLAPHGVVFVEVPNVLWPELSL